MLFIGACTVCQTKHLDKWNESRRAWLHSFDVIIASRDSQENIDRFRKATNFQLPITADPKGHLAERYNAVWVPRAYAVDAEGRVAWVQTEEALTNDPRLIITEATKAIRRKQ